MNNNFDIYIEDAEPNFNGKWVNEATVLNEKIREITGRYYELEKYQGKIHHVIEKILGTGAHTQRLRSLISYKVLKLLSRAVEHRQVINGRGVSAVGAALFLEITSFRPESSGKTLKKIIVSTLGIRMTALESAIKSFEIFLRDEPFLVTKLPRRIKLNQDEIECRSLDRQYKNYYLI